MHRCKFANLRFRNSIGENYAGRVMMDPFSVKGCITFDYYKKYLLMEMRRKGIEVVFGRTTIAVREEGGKASVLS